MHTVFVAQKSKKVPCPCTPLCTRRKGGEILIECLALGGRKSGVPSRVGCATELEVQVFAREVSLLFGFWTQLSLGYSYGVDSLRRIILLHRSFQGLGLAWLGLVVILVLVVLDRECRATLHARCISIDRWQLPLTIRNMNNELQLNVHAEELQSP